MRNAFTRGTKGFYAARHTLFPINEDKALACRVISRDDDMVQVVKLFDEDETVITADAPPGDLQVGQLVVIHRMPNLTWLCPNLYPGTFCRDLGDGTGQEVTYVNRAWVELENIRPLLCVEPATFFHNTAPNFAQDRIYWAQKTSNAFLVWLSGFGESEQIFSQVTEGDDYEYDLKFYTDNQGNVLNFTASARELATCTECSPVATVVCPERGNKTYTLLHEGRTHAECGGHSYDLCKWELALPVADEYNVKKVTLVWHAVFCQWTVNFYRYLHYGTCYKSLAIPDNPRGNYNNPDPSSWRKNPDLGYNVTVDQACQPPGWWT